MTSARVLVELLLEQECVSEPEDRVPTWVFACISVVLTPNPCSKSWGRPCSAPVAGGVDQKCVREKRRQLQERTLGGVGEGMDVYGGEVVG